MTKYMSLSQAIWIVERRIKLLRPSLLCSLGQKCLAAKITLKQGMFFTTAHLYHDSSFFHSGKPE